VNPSTALATVVVDELIRQGVREAVLCPGSRSAVFAYVLAEADRAGSLRLHVRVDERSAGFLALGMAKLTRRPVPVFTTSGTAVANLHPAVLEASHAAVPLIIVSADRPPELQGTGANQTTDQGHLFGGAVAMFHQLGAPERREGQNTVWRSVVSRLYATATGAGRSDPGPVHLNVPLREPLVPDPPDNLGGLGGDAGVADVDAVHSVDGFVGADGADGVGRGWPESLEGRDDEGPWVRVQPPSARTEALAAVPKTLVLLGDLPDPAMAVDVVDLAGAAGWPVIAEPFGAHDRQALVPHGPLLLTATEWLGRNRPDRVLVVGRVTLSRAVGALVRDPRVAVELVCAQSLWPDPWHVASVVHPFEAVLAPIPGGRQVDEQWAQEWADAGERVAKAAEVVIRTAWPSGLSVASAVLAGLPSEATLFVGSSNPVRDIDLAMSPALRREQLTIVASRGLAGIDGCVSTAIGLALSRPQRATYALMGDLTFLHDSNGLLIGPQEPRPDLTIVVVNDDGGGIFTLLEPGDPGRSAHFERVFATPTGTSIADICSAHGVRHALASTQAQLTAELRRPPAGIGVLEVLVDRSGHRPLHAELRAAAASALGE
jgi:2-succinyl-5-enolpyruvyl-6-hydroxy-3-cyclohexene-1-carboxylate synthase